jgi:hypothetical protein
MPKTRTSSIASRDSRSRSSSVASGSGGLSPDIAVSDQETSQRVNDRLTAAGVIEVQVPSRTRGQVENVSVLFSGTPGLAEVGSASGSSYTVDFENGTCTCMHYQMREERCRHLDAVDNAIGQVVERRSSPVALDVNTAVAQRADQDHIDEVNRNQIFSGQEDDNYFYLDNEEEFNRALEHGVEQEYEYDNVLNGSDITFGLELEFVGGNADAIARELYNQGICAYDERVRYHAPSVAGKWKLERDGSVSDSSGGGEIVSPVLRDTPETWRNLEIICEVAKRHGARIDYRCGGHVHIGMEPLDTARQRWRRFFKVMSGYEECIFRAAGGDEGSIRSNHRTYATPFSNRARVGSITSMALNDEYDVRNLASRVSQNDRYYGINLTNISEINKPNTVEFRYFNGSLNPKQLQANVKLAAGVIMAAEKARTRDGESGTVTDSFKRRGKLVNDYDSTENRSDKKIVEFLDIIFTRKKDKDALINVFRKNRWR